MAKSKTGLDEASRYLASTLHEIRTPIQTIIGTVELLQDTNLDKEQREYIRQIQFSADVLLDLANNILDFTKIRSNEFKLESVPFNIKELTEQVVDLISIEAFNRGLEIITDIDYSIPSFVTGDPVRIQQIILNLLKNAVKFTNNGYIHIELRREKDQLYFKVADSGIGITEDQKSKLFTNYYQADISTYRRFGGTGLGLSICKNLVTVMNGTIGVEANPTGGSIFWFRIPLISPVNIEEAEALISPVQFPLNQKILIVDDSQMAASSLTAILNNFGIKEIVSTTKPQDSIRLLEQAEAEGKPFTLAFIDMIMPVMDGWRLANEIKNSTSIKNSPLLYLLVPEGQMRSEAKMKMLNWFKGYLYKPFKNQKILDLLEDAFKKEDESLEELELASDDTLKAQMQSDDSKLAAGRKILIAEDHPVNRKLLETFVRKFGADVYLAEDGEQAVNEINNTPDMDLIFMDIQMPVKTGIEATIEIRKAGYNGVIVACTANNDENDFISYKKIGINDIIVKPFKSSAIKAILENWSTIMELPDFGHFTTLESDLVNKGQAWDEADFMDTTGGDKALAKSIISTYISQTDSFIQQAEECLKQNNFEELRRLGHSLAGSSGTVSAKKLSEYGSRINLCAKNMDTQSLRHYLDEFNHDYQQFKKLTGIFLEKNK